MLAAKDQHQRTNATEILKRTHLPSHLQHKDWDAVDALFFLRFQQKGPVDQAEGLASHYDSSSAESVARKSLGGPVL